MRSVGKTTDLVSEIAAASQEQARDINHLNAAIGQMDKVTQQNAANAEESASASEELAAQATSMNDIVSDLVSLVGTTDKVRSAKADRPPVRHRGRGHSDIAFHSVAEGQRTSGARPARVNPQRNILLPEDAELNCLNG